MIASGLRLLILALLFTAALGAAACRDEAAANLQAAKSNERAIEVR